MSIDKALYAEPGAGKRNNYLRPKGRRLHSKGKNASTTRDLSYAMPFDAEGTVRQPHQAGLGKRQRTAGVTSWIKISTSGPVEAAPFFLLSGQELPISKDVHEVPFGRLAATISIAASLTDFNYHLTRTNGPRE